MSTTEWPEAPAPTRRPLHTRVSLGHVVMVVAGLVGGLSTLAALRAADHRVLVAVAAHDLDDATRITSDDLRYERIAAGGRVLRSLLRPEEATRAAGLVTAHPIGAGDLVSRRDLVARAAPLMRRAMSIPIDPARAVNGRLEPGDRVDVLVATEHEVAIVVADAEVLDVNDPADGGVLGGARSEFGVTLAVDARESQLLAAAIADGDVFVARVTGAPSAAGVPPLPIEFVPLVGGTP